MNTMQNLLPQEQNFTSEMPFLKEQFNILLGFDACSGDVKENLSVVESALRERLSDGRTVQELFAPTVAFITHLMAETTGGSLKMFIDRRNVYPFWEPCVVRPDSLFCFPVTPALQFLHEEQSLIDRIHFEMKGSRVTGEAISKNVDITVGDLNS
jgi:hypothetical protein